MSSKDSQTVIDEYKQPVKEQIDSDSDDYDEYNDPLSFFFEPWDKYELRLHEKKKFLELKLLVEIRQKIGWYDEQYLKYA